MPKNYIKEFLSEDDLRRVSAKISDVERQTTGEVRLCIKVKRGFREKKFTPRELAMNDFFNLKMDKTKDKTGVLIFILFQERKFEIVADEGINNKIREDTWSKIKEEMIHEFRLGRYYTGIVKAIEDIGSILTVEFPASPDDKDELDNEVIIN